MSQRRSAARRDAATLLEALAHHPPAERMAAHGRLIEELERRLRAPMPPPRGLRQFWLR